jgi:hypothetical protein
VASFVAAQFRGSAVNRIYKKSTPCQTLWWHTAASRARILRRY